MKKNKEHILKDTKNNNKKIAINNIYGIILTNQEVSYERIKKDYNNFNYNESQCNHRLFC